MAGRKQGKSQKTQIVAFKVEEELAEFLNKLPNKSDFIRKAIVAQFGMTCPFCDGAGVVSRGLHKHYAPLIAENRDRPCDNCSESVQLPLSLDGVEGEDEYNRMEQFFQGGPLFCEKCYKTIPACDDCGWHIPLEAVADHHRSSHMN